MWQDPEHDWIICANANKLRELRSNLLTGINASFSYTLLELQDTLHLLFLSESLTNVKSTSLAHRLYLK